MGSGSFWNKRKEIVDELARTNSDCQIIKPAVTVSFSEVKYVVGQWADGKCTTDY